MDSSAALLQQLEKCSASFFSFDVFDTLVTRTLTEPQGVFLIMQEQLSYDCPALGLPPFFKHNFAALRQEAARYAREYVHAQRSYYESNLDEIYGSLAHNYDLDSTQVKALIELELAVEHACLIPLEERIALLRSLYYSGRRVVLISDMYLSAAQIRALLLPFDREIFSSIPLYVSSEARLVKGFVYGNLGTDFPLSGGLFQYVRQQERIAYADWVHLGDNLHSDILPARGLGIRALHLKAPPPLPLERRGARLKESVLSLGGGCARALRFEQTHAGSAAYTLGSALTGPVFYEYTSYVLQEALKQGYRRLYFVARDGYTVKKIADVIIKERALPLETHYIYGSRNVWRVPCAANLEIFLRHLTYDAAAHPPFKKRFLALIHEDLRVKLKPRFEELALLFGLPERGSLRSLNAFSGALRSDHKLCELILEYYEPSRAQLIRYLKQELELTEPFALVDVNGSGVTQKYLEDLLISECGAEDFIYYYFAKSDLNFFASQKLSYRQFSPQELDILFEALCLAAHPKTVAYTEQEGRIVPVFEETAAEDGLRGDFKLKDYFQGIEDYACLRTQTGIKLQQVLSADAGDLPAGRGAAQLYDHSCALTCCYHDFLLTGCDRSLARLLATLPFAYDVHDKNSGFARPLSLSMLAKLLITHRRPFKSNIQEALALKLSSRPLRGLYRIFTGRGSADSVQE